MQAMTKFCLGLHFLVICDTQTAARAFSEFKNDHTSFSFSFYFKLQQMVNEAQNKESFEEQSEPATHNN